MADFSSSPVPFPEVFREDLINPGAAISRSIQPPGITPRHRPRDTAGKHLARILQLQLPSHRSTEELFLNCSQTTRGRVKCAYAVRGGDIYTIHCTVVTTCVKNPQPIRRCGLQVGAPWLNHFSHRTKFQATKLSGDRIRAIDL